MIFAEMSEDMPIEALNVSLNYVPLASTTAQKPAWRVSPSNLLEIII